MFSALQSEAAGMTRIRRGRHSPLSGHLRHVRSSKRRAARHSSRLFLDRFEELRMELSNEQLIAEAIEINHAGTGKERRVSATAIT